MTQLKTVPGMEHLKIIDTDTIEAIVDGSEEPFSRSDRYSQMPGSGLAHFGPVTGDWRMIEAIADDIAEAFTRVDTATATG